MSSLVYYITTDNEITMNKGDEWTVALNQSTYSEAGLNHVSAVSQTQ